MIAITRPLSSPSCKAFISNNHVSLNQKKVFSKTQRQSTISHNSLIKSRFFQIQAPRLAILSPGSYNRFTANSIDCSSIIPEPNFKSFGSPCYDLVKTGKRMTSQVARDIIYTNSNQGINTGIPLVILCSIRPTKPALQEIERSATPIAIVYPGNVIKNSTLGKNDGFVNHLKF